MLKDDTKREWAAHIAALFGPSATVHRLQVDNIDRCVGWINDAGNVVLSYVAPTHIEGISCAYFMESPGYPDTSVVKLMAFIVCDDEVTALLPWLREMTRRGTVYIEPPYTIWAKPTADLTGLTPEGDRTAFFFSDRVKALVAGGDEATLLLWEKQESND